MTFFRATALTIIAMITAGIALVASPRPAGACMCIDTPLSEYADEVDVAFTGWQIGRFQPSGPVLHSADDTLLVLRVDRVFKGRAASLITLVTVVDEGSCGIDFRGSGTVTVVASMWEEDLRVGLCDSRHTVDEFEESFGPGYPPEGTFDLAGLFGNLIEKIGSRRPPNTPDIAAIAPTEPSTVSDNTPTSGRTTPALVLLIGAALIVFISGAAAWRRQGRPSDNR